MKRWLLEIKWHLETATSVIIFLLLYPILHLLMVREYRASLRAMRRYECLYSNQVGELIKTIYHYLEENGIKVCYRDYSDLRIAQCVCIDILPYTWELVPKAIIQPKDGSLYVIGATCAANAWFHLDDPTSLDKLIHCLKNLKKQKPLCG